MSDPHKDTILIVEPDANQLALLKVHFELSGDFKFQTASTGQETLSVALKFRPKLILLETQLPDKPGLAVLRELRQQPRTAHIPVIFLAGGTEVFLQNQILAAGADDFIQKPLDVAELTLRIRNVLRRSRTEATVHPLSRLPTGDALKQALERAKSQANFVQAQLTLEYFDTFKDVYGFVTANEVIIFVSNVINDAVTELGTPEDFLAHRKEAEFVILTEKETAEKLTQQLKGRLDAQLPQFYSFTEREQGYVELPEGTQKPLMQLRADITKLSP